MTNKYTSPAIVQHVWGRLQIEDGRVFKDAKLFPGGAREWDWRETGTHHVPGIQPADVAELIDHGATTVVFGQGFQEQLQVSPETFHWLEKHDIQVHVLQTDKAVQKYNELCHTTAVAGLFHTTC